MSVHRYIAAQVLLSDLSQYVADGGLAVANAPGAQVDITLANDANKEDLDVYMEERNFTFLETGPTGAPNGNTQSLMFGAGVIAIAGTQFLLPGFSLAAAVGGVLEARIPFTRQLRGIAVRHNGLGVGAGLFRYTVTVGGAPTAITVDVPLLSAGASASFAPIIVPANSDVGLRVEKIGVIVAAAANVVALVE